MLSTFDVREIHRVVLLRATLVKWNWARITLTRRGKGWSERFWIIAEATGKDPNSHRSKLSNGKIWRYRPSNCQELPKYQK